MEPLKLPTPVLRDDDLFCATGRGGDPVNLGAEEISNVAAPTTATKTAAGTTVIHSAHTTTCTASSNDKISQLQ